MSQPTRRQAMRMFAALGASGAALLITRDAGAAPPRRRRRRRRRRRIRRRTRRRVRRVMRSGRWLVQVPAATAIGWELVIEDRVLIVTDVKIDGDTESLVLKPIDGGQAQTVEVVREDTPENGEDHEGSEIEDERQRSATNHRSSSRPSRRSSRRGW